MIRESFIYLMVVIIYAAILLRQQDREDFEKLLSLYPEPALYLLFTLFVYFLKLLWRLCIYPQLTVTPLNRKVCKI